MRITEEIEQKADLFRKYEVEADQMEEKELIKTIITLRGIRNNLEKTAFELNQLVIKLDDELLRQKQ